MKVHFASEAHTKAAFTHAKVGTYGYQEIETQKNEVVRLLDEAGNTFPADAVFGYEVVDDNPPPPAWAIIEAPVKVA
jgi:hypothetical protein